jgi:hypothetical protein
LQPLEAVNSFYFVNGKVALYGEMAISQVIKCGHKIEWGICNKETATVTITRGDNGASNSVTFTMAEANERGLTAGKDVWKKFPDNMLRFKAFHSCARFTVPDALHGVPIKEVIEAEYVEEIDDKKKIKTDEKKTPKPAEELNTEPSKNIPAADLPSLEEAIKKEPEEKKTLLENVLENFPGSEIVGGEKPSEKPLSKGMEAMKAAKEKAQSKK